MANFVSFECNTDVEAVCKFITFWSIYVSSFENAVVLSPTRVMMHLNEVENLDQTVEVAIMGWCPADWSTCHEYVRVNLSCWLDTKVKTWPFHQSCFSVENIKRRWERGVKGFAKWMVNVMGVGRVRLELAQKKPWSRFNGFVSLSPPCKFVLPLSKSFFSFFFQQVLLTNLSQRCIIVTRAYFLFLEISRSLQKPSKNFWESLEI